MFKCPLVQSIPQSVKINQGTRNTFFTVRDMLMNFYPQANNNNYVCMKPGLQLYNCNSLEEIPNGLNLTSLLLKGCFSISWTVNP